MYLMDDNTPRRYTFQQIYLEAAVSLKWIIEIDSKPFAKISHSPTCDHQACIYSKFVLPTRKSLEVIIKKKKKR